jgi:predicted SpoU family rRNA methylase
VTGQEKFAALQEAQDEINEEFKDVDGNLVHIGSYVHYVPDVPREPWTESRWGIVVGMTRTERWDYANARVSDENDCQVKVIAPYVVRSRDDHQDFPADEWYCDPSRVRVISQ